MSYWILIRGPLGIGKSTIAKRLAKKSGAKYVSIDSILEKHGLDKINHYRKRIPAKNFIKANEIILAEIKEKLKKGQIVILDGCFYYKRQIKHLTNNLKNSKHYIFTLKAALPVCIERDCKRKKTYGKDAATAVYNLVSKFDYGIVIDVSKKSIYQTIQKILLSLKRKL